MTNYGINHLGTRTEFRKGPLAKIYEGVYRGGFYHLVKLERQNLKAEFVVADKLKDPAFVAGHSHAVPQGRVADKEEIKRVVSRGDEFKAAGKQALADYLKANPKAIIVSDASNYPWLEGHFSIQDGQLLPAASGSPALSGKHSVLSTTGGNVSFPLVDTENPKSIKAAEQGFFVTKIIHNGYPIRLLDEVPGTGRLAISNYRGHIGQLFRDYEYSEMNSQKRADIHAQLIEYLRNPHNYLELIKDIINGKPISIGGYNGIVFPQNVYSHTYWLESKAGNLFCLKTYPSKDGSSVGATLNEAADLLFAFGRTYGFQIQHAFIGTNGRDVRIILNREGQPEAIRTLEDYPNQILGDGKSFDRPLVNFIAFYAAD
jgi:hypothetical protein